MILLSQWRTARMRRWLRKCEYVGKDAILAGRPTVAIDGGQVRIGDRFRLVSQPVASHLVAGPGALLTIGNDVSIGCGAAIAAFQHIEIGDGTRIGPYVIIMDTSFHGASGDQSVQHDCRPVTIGRSCRIGSRVTITRGATIGDGAEILAGSVVTSTIPPGVCAAGSRARIIGRANELSSRWDSVAAVIPEILMESLSLRSPPDLDSNLMPTQPWSDAQVSSFRLLIRDRTGATLDPLIIREFRSFAEITTAVEHALARRHHSA